MPAFEECAVSQMLKKKKNHHIIFVIPIFNCKNIYILSLYQPHTKTRIGIITTHIHMTDSDGASMKFRRKEVTTPGVAEGTSLFSSLSDKVTV